MSFRAFTYACETLRLQQQERFHVETPVAEFQPTPEELRARNRESMAALGAMLGGVQGGPTIG